MKAIVKVDFTDGSFKNILVDTIQSLEVPEHMRQSISVNQNHNGKFTLAYTKGLMSGKSWESITIKKEP